MHFNASTDAALLDGMLRTPRFLSDCLRGGGTRRRISRRIESCGEVEPMVRCCAKPFADVLPTSS